MGGKWSLASAALGLVSVAAPSARAETAAVQLRYEREPGTEACPSPDQLRASVAARLGYDPFVPKSETAIHVRIRSVTGRLEGFIERERSSARPTTITSHGTDCTELASALAVGIAIAIDPLSLTRDPPPIPPPSAPASPFSTPLPQPAPMQREAPPPAPAVATPVHLQLGGGPSLATGALPAASFGVRAFAGVSRGMFELDLEGRFDPPVSLSRTGGSIDASLALASLLPCAWFRFASACAQLSIGALRGTGLGFDHTREDNTLYLAAGGRIGAELPLGRNLAARLAVEAQLPLRPTHFDADGATVWSTPSLSLAAVPMLVGRFP